MRLLQSIDARVKLLCLVVYLVAALHARTPVAVGLCLALAVAFALATRLGARAFFGVLRPLAAILVVTVVMQVLYIRQGTVLVTFGPVDVTAEALLASARMLVCLLCVMVASVAFMRCTAVEDLMRALAWLLVPLRRAGLRVDGFLLSLSIAFRFVPVLVEEFRQLRRAQQARLGSFEGGVGARVFAYTRLFAPLVRSSYRRADMLAEGCYSRCFACGARTTSLHVSRVGASEACCVLLACALVVCVVLL